MIGFLCITAPALSADWTEAEEGVQVNGQMAFPGCAPARSIVDEKALKIATLRAQANVARSQSKMVSGEEQLLYGKNKDQYKVTIYETNEAYMNKVSIIERKIAPIDGVEQLCVLIDGNYSRKY